MRETLQKHLRTFKRDYWDGSAEPASHSKRTVPLSSDIKIAGVLTTVFMGAIALCLPHLVAGVAMTGVLLFTSLAGWRTAKVKKNLAPQSVATLALEGDRNDFTTLSGPARALSVVLNTQRMLEHATKDYQEYCMPEETRRQLAPYFNDCAAAMAQLTAEVGGKPLDSVSLTRICLLTDDYDGIPVGSYRQNIIEMPTRAGVERKQAAERAADVAQTLIRMQHGTGNTLTVKRIKLKARA